MEKVLGLVEVLRVSSDREEAYNYIKCNKLTVANLKQVAKELDLWVNAKWGKSDLTEKIVEMTIGARVNIKALMGK